MIKYLMIFLFLFLILGLILKMNSSYELVLFFILLFSTLWMMNSNQLMSFWLAMETQSFSLMLLMIYDNMKKIENVESIFKYFIMSAISSMFLLIGLSSVELSKNLLSASNLICNIKESFVIFLMLFPLIIKLGGAPFHFWVPEMYQGMNYGFMMLISSIPKLTLMMFLFKLPIFNNFILLISLFSMIVGSIGGLNQSNFKILMAYSGMAHLGFILLSTSIFVTYFVDFSVFYFLIYMISNMGMLLMFLKKKMNYLIQFSSSFSNNKFYGLMMMMFLLSWLGIPPFSGFLGKWIIMIGSIFSGNNLMIFMLMFSTLLTSFFYLSMILFLFLENFYMNNFMNLGINKINQLTLKILIIFSYFSLFVIFNPSLINLIMGN